MIKYIFTFIIITFLIHSCAHEEFKLDEKYLIKKFEIKSRSMYVDLYRNDSLIYSSKEKSIWDSCLYDTNGNRTEDYYGGFDGKIYKNVYNYDKFGRKIKAETRNFRGDTITASRTYEYDDTCLVSEIRNGPNNTNISVTRYFYNKKHQLISKIDSGQYEIKYTYEYDEWGNLVMTAEENPLEPVHRNKRDIKYDDAGRIMTVTNYGSEGTVNMVEHNKYDDRGNVIEKLNTWPGRSLNQRLLYSYDSLNRVTKFLEYENGKEMFNTSYVYNESGLLTEKRNYDPYGKLGSVYRYVYEYY
jgi:YD repeat-containing protein